MLALIESLALSIVKLLASKGDRDKELEALLAAADVLADEIERRKFKP